MAREGATPAHDTSNLIRSLFALLPIPVAVIDADGNVVFANSTFDDFFPKITCVKQMHDHAVRAKGSIFDFDRVPLSDPGLHLFVGRDTTCEERLRQKLFQMERMGSIGQMVSGAAHELNNPLACIVGYAQLLSDVALEPSTRRMVSILKKEAEHAGNIVQNFMSLATRTQSDKRSFDLNSVVGKVLSLRRYDHDIHDIVTIPQLQQDLPQVFGDRGQIEQVVLNLVVNAEVAVRAGGDPASEIAIRTATIENRVRLEVTDSGIGAQSIVKELSFEPFFPTAGKLGGNGGIGLSLNVCCEIVKDHGGALYAWMSRGRGSTFTMELPVATPIDSLGPGTLEPSSGASLRGKRIMVVDDEVIITDLIGDYLGRFGADVEFLHSGTAAFERLLAKSYDAVVCDQRMPGLNGQDLYRMVCSVDPDLARRFIFVTGDGLNRLTHEFLEESGALFLRKPFRLENLLRSIETIVRS